VKEGGREGRN